MTNYFGKARLTFSVLKAVKNCLVRQGEAERLKAAAARYYDHKKAMREQNGKEHGDDID